jgi:hypothetical protein
MAQNNGLAITVRNIKIAPNNRVLSVNRVGKTSCCCPAIWTRE